MSPVSPYRLDRSWQAAFKSQFNGLAGKKIFYDGVFKGDYSLAIVNRQLARALITAGHDVQLFTPETGWKGDPRLGEMPDVLAHCRDSYPTKGEFDVHLRNTWPLRADDMIGSLNAYVCLAWEESKVPRDIVDHFNTHLDLIMVTANFVEHSFRSSGLSIPIHTVGNGVNHLQTSISRHKLQTNFRKNILHISSCFPRKGADVLVSVFREYFSANDDVELVIKTFDNPHNTIEQMIKRGLAERPDAPMIRLIKESKTSAEIAELIRNSSVMALPTRGEGFGLPLAEALMLGTPVVTTNYSGQTDFCGARTAWLVDYTLQPSTAHVSASGSLWAEPDRASLARALRQALYDHAASESKVGRGQALLEAHFKWSDVARRVSQAISISDGVVTSTGRSVRKQADFAKRAPEITIDLISSWNQKCGIATYSKHLFEGGGVSGPLKTVFAREIANDALPTDGAHTDQWPGLKVVRPWGYNSAGVRRLGDELAKGVSSVVWFQHHPGFFSHEDMEILSGRLGVSSYKLKVITLHNVRETLSGCAAWLRRFDIIVVHTHRDREELAERGFGSISVIPHGILPPRPAPAPGPGGFTIGTFGFLEPHKNARMIVNAVAIARAYNAAISVKLLTCTRQTTESLYERAVLETLVDELQLNESVELDFAFLSDDEIIDRLAACDLLCFPYGNSNESATGAVRIALAADRPLLCSRSMVLHDLLPYAFVLEKLDAKTLAEAIIVLSASSDLLALKDDVRRDYVATNLYVNVAQKHLDLFSRMMRQSSNAR